MLLAAATGSAALPGRVPNSGELIGSENLYVAEASVMPRLPTANTNIPTIMIVEKVSDALLSQ